MKTCDFIRLALAAALASGVATAAAAAPPVRTKRPPVESAPRRFPLQDGKSIYEGVCQGCHMAGGKGAVGAGAYPALAENSNLQVSSYPAAVVIHGQKAMPPLGQLFTDRQVAEVVNYVRANFGNHYTDEITPAEVKLMR